MRKTLIRWPILAAAIAGVVIAAGLLSWYMLSQRSSASVSGGAEETTLLIVGVQTLDGGTAMRELLLLRGSEEDAAGLFIPPEIAVKSSDGSFTSLEDVYAREGAESVCDAVSELLRVIPSAMLVLDDAALVAFVDELDGLPLEVELGVQFAPSEASGERVELEAGERVLSGSEALAFLRGESEMTLATRREQLLRAVVASALTGQSDRAVHSVADRLREASSSEVRSSLVRQIARQIAAADPETLRVGTIPTDDVLIEGQLAVHPRIVEMERLLASIVRGMELLTPTEIRVAVFNGNGVRLMASQTADYLRARAFEVTRIANAEMFEYPTSYIVVLTDEAKAWVLRDALPTQVSIVFPDAFEEHMQALEGLAPFGTDLLLIAGLDWSWSD